MKHREKQYKNNELFNIIWNSYLTQVEKSRVDSMDLIATDIYSNNIEGDIVECGVWRGGMIMYLANLYLDRTIWAVDSYQGFQKVSNAKYKYDGVERHTHDINHIVGFGLNLKVSLKEVKQYLQQYKFIDSNIKFLKGWVKDTLDPSVCEIEKIALLRIDVDAYSATLEVLENLYDKVVVGGYIVFDDSGVSETIDAIKQFKKNRNINFDLIYPPKANKQGAYFKKQ